MIEISLRLTNAHKDKLTLEANQDQSYEAKQKLDFAAFIEKRFNHIVLKIIEYAELNNLITSLFFIIFDQKISQRFEISSFYNLAYKMLSRIQKTIRKVVDRLDLGYIFLQAHHYIVNCRQSDQSGYKAIKNFIIEIIINLDPEFVRTCYLQAFPNGKDTHIARWITMIEAKR